MFDCRAAKVYGAVSFSKARVIWRDGLIYGFNTDGLVFSFESDRPTRRSGYIRAWDAKTTVGVIHIDEACWTCGGWIKVAMKSADNLISESQ